MRMLVTGKQMKAIDAYTIHTIGIPSLVLMERAALKVALAAERLYFWWEIRIREQRNSGRSLRLQATWDFSLCRGRRGRRKNAAFS